MSRAALYDWNWPRMATNDESILKHFAAAMVIAVVLYASGFAWIQHRRTMKGPWEVTFQSDAAGHPSIIIRQPTLGILEMLTFPGESVSPNLAVRKRFSEATTNAPFGRIIFQDPTFLPGTLTMGLFGHQVEALPRVLIIDKRETAWTPNGAMEVAKRN